MKKAMRLLAVPVVLALIAGCSKPPEQEMASADAAVQAAANVQAAKYAPADWEMLQDTLQAAKAEKAAQDSRFALFRSYGKSKGMFAKAAGLAATTKTKAEAEKARVKAETQQMLSVIRVELDSTAAMVGRAPVGKDTKAEIELMKQDLAAIQQTMAEADAEYNRENFDAAKSKATAVRDRSNALKTQLEQAMAKSPKRRR